MAAAARAGQACRRARSWARTPPPAAEYLALEAAIADPAKRTGAYQQPWLAR